MAYLPVPARMLDDMEIRLSNVIKQEGIHTRNIIVQAQGKTRHIIENCLCTVNQTIHTFAGHIKDLDAEIRMNSLAQRAPEQAKTDHLVEKTEASLRNLVNALSDVQSSLSHISIDIFELDQSRAHNGRGISCLERDMGILLSNTRETDDLLGEVIARLPRQEPTAPASPDVSDGLCDLIETRNIGNDAELVWTNKKEVLGGREAAIASTNKNLHESGGVFGQLVDIAPVESEHGSDGNSDGEDLDGEGRDDEASNHENSDGEVINFDIPHDFARDEAMLRDCVTRELVLEILRKLDNFRVVDTLALADETTEGKIKRLGDWIDVLKHYTRLQTNQIKDLDEMILAERSRSPAAIEEATPQEDAWEVMSSSSSKTFAIPDTSTDDSPKLVREPPFQKCDSNDDKASNPPFQPKSQTQSSPEVTQPATHQPSVTLGRGRPDATESERRRLLRAATIFDVSLPRGWEARTSEKEQTYYIDHATRSTSWVRPILESEVGTAQEIQL